jgi:hypothetical protein
MAGCIDQKCVGNMAESGGPPSITGLLQTSKKDGRVISNFAMNFGPTSVKSWQQFKKGRLYTGLQTNMSIIGGE